MSEHYCEYAYGQGGNHIKRTNILAFLELRVFFSGEDTEGVCTEVVTL